MLTLFILLPVVLGVNPYWKLKHDVSPVESDTAGDVTRGVMKTLSIQNYVITSIVCPNGMTQCPDNSTCCPMAGEEMYGCCPGNNAVCCAETYCCPEGYSCNVAKGTCVRNGLEVASYLIQEVEVEHVVCPDKSSQCPDKNTCCKLADGNYACCPLENAVCCSDHSHCCPQGYTCDVTKAMCTHSSPHEVVTSTIADVPCPDGHSCADGNTCCLTSGGIYGCCPQPNAVCCSDHKHCCPEGYQCDIDSGTCIKRSAIETLSLIERVKDVRDIVCPGNEYSCPYGGTCCSNQSGGSGCCPLPHAVCCTDGAYCCPNGYTCDVTEGSCVKSSLDCNKETENCERRVIVKTIDFAEVMKAHKVNVKDSICSCPSPYQTCCLYDDGHSHYCCAEGSANCCTKDLTCCPYGSICSGDGLCTNITIEETTDLTENVKYVEDNVNDIMCPGDQYVCPNGDTCCSNGSGGYECCPLPNAVCCSDHLHCCPGGYTCQVSTGFCLKSSDVLDRIPFLLKSPANRRL